MRRPRTPPGPGRRRFATSWAVGAALVVCVAVVAVVAAGGSAGAHHRTAAAVRVKRHAVAAVSRQQLAIDRTITRLRYVAVAGSRRREVALTFDDGPGPYTPRVVAVLRRLHVPATFFQIGFMLHYFPKAAREEVADPRFVLGDHTRSHPFLGHLSASEQAAQIGEEAAIARFHGAPMPRLFRPPYGSWNADTLRILRADHMLMVLWTIDSDDYRQPGVRAIVENVLSRVRPGAIILMHDAGGVRTQTIEALPYIVHALRRRHLRPVTVPQLLADDPPPAHQPLATGAG